MSHVISLVSSLLHAITRLQSGEELSDQDQLFITLTVKEAQRVVQSSLAPTVVFDDSEACWQHVLTLAREYGVDISPAPEIATAVRIVFTAETDPATKYAFVGALRKDYFVRILERPEGPEDRTYKIALSPSATLY